MCDLRKVSASMACFALIFTGSAARAEGAFVVVNPRTGASTAY
jgi:hypothetical protein